MRMWMSWNALCNGSDGSKALVSPDRMACCNQLRRRVAVCTNSNLRILTSTPGLY